jgi:hypothetical protein
MSYAALEEAHLNGADTLAASRALWDRHVACRKCQIHNLLLIANEYLMLVVHH